ncbi:MAG: hypothetical protein GQ582_04810 [Methyloprofundus sp.]|nr:hypothetical protein [Methyloprofundus sp.]
MTQSSKWVYEAYELKETFAQTIKENKVVIVSGSNSLFGFNSIALESYWKRPVVNDAVNVDLGLAYILHKSKKILARGDIAILPIEYALYREDGKPREAYSDYVLSRDSDYFRELALFEQLTIISRISINRLFNGMKFFFNKKLWLVTGLYGAQNMNSHGDQINTEPSKMTKEQVLIISRLSETIIDNSELSDYFMNTMNEYIAWAKASGICIVVMPPTYTMFSSYKEEKYTHFFVNIKDYYASKSVKFLGTPLVYMYEKKYYFNSADHLNSVGVKKRTLQVMNDIGSDIGLHC